MDVVELVEDAPEEDIVAYNKHYNESTKVAYLMLETMSSYLQKNFEDWWIFYMNQTIKEMFQVHARK